MAWWRFGSKRSPLGAILVMPFLSRSRSISRAVISTPSRSAEKAASRAWRRSAGTASSARFRLSPTASMSPANLVNAYLRASVTSRSVRRRRLSMSAASRKSRSVRSAFSASSLVISAVEPASWSIASSHSTSSLDGRVSAGSAASSAASGAAPSAGFFGSVSVIFSSSSGLPAISKFWCENQGSAAEELRHQLRGIIHRRHDARIVQPRRTDDAEHADHPVGGIAKRRDYQRGPGERKQLVLRADEDAHALALLGKAEELDEFLFRFQVVEKQPYALQILQRLHVADQVRHAAHDQRAGLLARARPGGDAGGDH